MPPHLEPGAVGFPISEFALRDYRGGERKLSDWADKKLIAIAFVGVDCPLANLYAARLEELAKEFQSQGVQFVSINSNQQDAVSDIERFVRAHKVSIPVLKDVGNAVADQFGAQRTPEVFLLDERRIIRYRGRIDDQYSVGASRAKIGRRDLAVAIDELLSGKPVSQPTTPAPGCLISRVSRSIQTGEVTYSKHIAGLFQKRCQVCHRPNQVAPFPLTNYAEAAAWADTIQEVVNANRMPPWHANPAHGKFANDPRLTDEEKRLINAWVKGGVPEGNPADLPPQATFPEGWTISKPDKVVPIAVPFTVPAEGLIDYQYFEVDPGFTEDKWVQQAEIRPGNRAVVHHCTVFLKPPGGEAAVMVGELGSVCLAATAPGTPPLVLKEGLAKRIPAYWHFVFVIHYTTNGTEQIDQTSIGLVFADPKQVKKEVATNIVLDTNLNIPPHEADYRVEHTSSCNKDVLLLALFPHMHLRGKSFRYEAEYPDGAREILLDVPHYDFNWEHRYELADPKLLPAGTILHVVAHYDNSAKNPFNPDPDATVHTGSQITDEMFNGYMELALADQDMSKPAMVWDKLRAAARFTFRPGIVLLAGAAFLMFRLIRNSLIKAR
ncbi:MAG: redoxin domain-containing protein [Gemmataceae bacterium]